MPNNAFGLPSNSRFDRSAHRNDSSMDAVAAVTSAGNGVHSSNTITMSLFNTRWMRIDSSGLRKQASPLTGDWNLTPSSLMFRSSPRLNT